MSKPEKQKLDVTTGTKISLNIARWQQVVVIPPVVKEGHDELTPGQYLHVKDQVKQLVGFGARRFDSELRIEPFEEFWELKDKGGVLGSKNIRVYFAFEQKVNDIVVLKLDKKEQQNMARPALKYILKNRLRLYRDGHFRGQLIRWKHAEDSARN